MASVTMTRRRDGILRRPTAMSGFSSWFTTIDHKKIGIMYGATALVFMVAGGVEALLIRVQLAGPNGNILTAAQYNTMFTMHGTTMVFFVGMPITLGFSNYLVPLMVGARDMAFPRLNAFSYWMYLLGGIVLYSSYFAAGGPARAGWTSYVPLSEKLYSSGNGQDYWILALHILSIASLAGAINFIVTIHNMRARGMTWMRMPLFVWAIETYAILLVAVVLPMSSLAGPAHHAAAQETIEEIVSLPQASVVHLARGEGKLQANIDRVMPLSEAAAAHRLQEESTVGKKSTLTGKIVLKI